MCSCVESVDSIIVDGLDTPIYVTGREKICHVVRTHNYGAMRVLSKSILCHQTTFLLSHLQRVNVSYQGERS